MITAMPRIAIAVRDFRKTLNLFRDVLGMPVVDLSDTSVASLGARLAMCVPGGGSNIELMSPADPQAPLSQSLTRFLDSRGEGLFALMLEAPDPDAEAEKLIQRGLNVLPLMAGAGGRDVHPNSTHGVLVRVYPNGSFQGRAEREDHGFDLSGIERVIIAVNDLDHAVSVYGDMFAMRISQPSSDPVRGVRSAVCKPPAGGWIELVMVEDPARPFANAVQAFLDRKKEGMYALVLNSPDLSKVIDTLASRDVEVHRSADSSEVLEIDTDFGVRLRIATR